MTFDKKTVVVVGGVAIVSIALSIALYYLASGSSRNPATVGTPMPSAPAAMPQSPPAGPMTGKSSLTMEQAADRLAKRLAQEDGSADDWALLARSYVELRQYPDAVRAFEQALKKSPGDAQLTKERDAARRAAGS
jgi:cytochrome c-type biogenesis protein CcmH/NrfG